MVITSLIIVAMNLANQQLPETSKLAINVYVMLKLYYFATSIYARWEYLFLVILAIDIIGSIVQLRFH